MARSQMRRGRAAAAAALSALAALSAAGGVLGLAEQEGGCGGVGRGACRKHGACKWVGRRRGRGQCAVASDECDAVQGRGRRKRCASVATAQCECSRKPRKSRGKCGTCRRRSPPSPGPDGGMDGGCSSKNLDTFVWVPNNSAYHWPETANQLRENAKTLIAAPYLPSNNTHIFRGDGTCHPFAANGGGGGSAGLPGLIAEEMCKNLTSTQTCKLYVTLGLGNRHPNKYGPGISFGSSPDQWAENIEEVVKIFNDCVKNGNGKNGGWPAEMGPAPPTVGILCLESYNWQAGDTTLDCTASVDGVSFIETMKKAGYEVGLLKQKSNSISGLGISGSELYNGCIASGGDGSCCTNTNAATCCPERMGYGSPMTAKSIGTWMANSTMWNSKGDKFPLGSTSFAGGGTGARCAVPVGSSFDEVADYYFNDPTFPKELPCNFGIWGGR